jgi:hypothetical protein
MRIPKPAHVVSHRPYDEYTYRLEQANRAFAASRWRVRIEFVGDHIPPYWSVPRQTHRNLTIRADFDPTDLSYTTSMKMDRLEIRRYAGTTTIFFDDEEIPRIGRVWPDARIVHTSGPVAYRIFRWPKEQFVRDPGEARRILRGKGLRGPERAPISQMKKYAEFLLNQPTVEWRRGRHVTLTISIGHYAFDPETRIVHAFDRKRRDALVGPLAPLAWEAYIQEKAGMARPE